jgi:hypothetical protein
MKGTMQTTVLPTDKIFHAYAIFVCSWDACPYRRSHGEFTGPSFGRFHFRYFVLFDVAIAFHKTFS